jgi:hypothetical protein
MPLPWRRAPCAVATATLAGSSSWAAGIHASRDPVPLPPTSDQGKATGGASTAVPAISVADEFSKEDAMGKPALIFRNAY